MNGACLNVDTAHVSHPIIDVVAIKFFPMALLTYV